MGEYPPLEPDFAALWEDSTATREDIAWAMLGTNPRAIEKEAAVTAK